MCKDILIGMALGVAVGMMLNIKKSDTESVVNKAKDVVRKKLNDIAEKI